MGDCSESAVYQNKREKHLNIFILTTNKYDGKVPTNKEMLSTYKEHGKVKRWFIFLKDPQFHATEVFVRKPARVEALQMVMVVCLLVYAALEHQLREGLKEKGETIPDQNKKPTHTQLVDYMLSSTVFTFFEWKKTIRFFVWIWILLKKEFFQF